jgi:hypothetical protein
MDECHMAGMAIPLNVLKNMSPEKLAMFMHKNDLSVDAWY